MVLVVFLAILVAVGMAVLIQSVGWSPILVQTGIA